MQWRAWPWRARAKGGVLALRLNDNTAQFVFAREADGRRASLSAWGTELRGSQTREAFVKRLRGVLPAAGRVIVVLDPSDYQIAQLEAPNVPPAELRGAVRWRAAEFLPGSPHDYAIDVLTVAGAGERAGRVIAVAAHNDLLRSRVLECDALGLDTAVIDVGETAQRNLLQAALAAEHDAPGVSAALVADGSRALIVIAVNGQLYFFRRFEFAADLVAVPRGEAQPEMIGGGEVAEAASRSLTQLQRSLDLWDDSYPHLPLATLRVHAGELTEAIVARIAPEAGVDTRPLALSGVFTAPERKGGPPWNDPAYLPLLGALLRPAGVA